MKGEHIGEFEELALLAVAALGERAYGIAVQELLERETSREVSLGAVYAALARMEQKGFVVSSQAEPTGERGGRRRRVFAVTRAGMDALAEARRARESMWTAAQRAERRRT
jgi:DNA-binding PadR family transcriptional regulator